MKIRWVIAVLTAAAFLMFPALAKDATVGDFVLKYAQSLNMKVSSVHDAMRSLQERGLIGQHLKSSSLITEGDLVDILNRAGIASSTVNPVNSIDDNSLDSVVASLTAVNSGSPSPAQQETRDGDDDANNNGKKTRPKGQSPNSRANPNAFYGREDEG